MRLHRVCYGARGRVLWRWRNKGEAPEDKDRRCGAHRGSRRAARSGYFRDKGTHLYFHSARKEGQKYCIFSFTIFRTELKYKKSMLKSSVEQNLPILKPTLYNFGKNFTKKMHSNTRNFFIYRITSSHYKLTLEPWAYLYLWILFALLPRERRNYK